MDGVDKRMCTLMEIPVLACTEIGAISSTANLAALDVLLRGHTYLSGESRFEMLQLIEATQIHDDK